ncbi:hypothetical protein NHQ30_010906 [Ciborinia camelliae]|nr:hypothetical protein NHQ30_010906 [Ciborinia camelliae]
MADNDIFRSTLVWLFIFTSSAFVVYTLSYAFIPFAQETYTRLSNVSNLRKDLSSGRWNEPGTDIFTGNTRTVNPLSNDARLKGDVVYIAEPKEATAKKNQGLIFFPDNTGISPGTRALADEYARSGYLTLAINYWGKHQKIGQTKDDVIPWDPRNPKNSPSILDRDRMINNAMIYLKENRKCAQIGGVGYGGGAAPLMNILQEDPCRLTAAFMASPERVDEEEIRFVKAPVSLAQCWDDRHVNVNARHMYEYNLIRASSLTREEEQLLESGILNPPIPWQMNLFSGVKHGFASRLPEEGPTTTDAIFAKRAAFIQAVSWFQTYMPQGRIQVKYRKV